MIHVAITGKMGAGKSALANFINTEYLKGRGVISSFAEPIKDIYKNRELLADFMISFNDIDGKSVKSSLLEYRPFMEQMKAFDTELATLPEGTKPRKHYQFIGQIVKGFYGENIWAKKLFSDFKHFSEIQKSLKNNIGGLIIDDLRMDIEYKEILSSSDDFIIIGVEVPEHDRLSIVKQNKLGDETTINNISEIEVDDIISDLKAKYPKSYYEFESGRRIVINNPNNGLTKERREILKLILKSYDDIK